ncbi:MAG: hypothetical protein J7L63_02985 [Thermoplasmata archaeon]|nr:hypothetical protein [Thermoplasmata archaeon]
MHKKQKLSYEDKMHIAKDIVEHGLATKYVAKLYDISVRWAQIIASDITCPSISMSLKLRRRHSTEKHRI